VSADASIFDDGNRQRALSLPSYKSARGEVPSLDGMRAISILAVMLSHMGVPWMPGGHGVFLFFIISGFLITRLLFAEQEINGRINPRNFYIRRFFRLYPVIVVYCLFIPSVYFIRDGYIDIIEPLSALFYFANYLAGGRDLAGIVYQMPFSIFWSLSVEEHFYIFFPMVVLLLRSPAKIFTFAVSVCVAVLAIRLSVAYFSPEVVQSHFMYTRTEFRIDSVAFGVALAAACELPRGQAIIDELTAPWGFAITLVIALCSIALGDDWFANIVRYSILGPCIALLMAAILFSARYRPFQLMLNLRPAIWVGRLSYSLYVWHLPCHLLAIWLMPGPGGVALAWMFSFAAAWASYRFVEQPALQFGKRYGGQPRPAIGQ
jgi:peptidoglycan/LPS O-acetylase OafA/YrhL